MGGTVKAETGNAQNAVEADLGAPAVVAEDTLGAVQVGDLVTGGAAEMGGSGDLGEAIGGGDEAAELQVIEVGLPVTGESGEGSQASTMKEVRWKERIPKEEFLDKLKIVRHLAEVF
ncbi:hypothetical protein HK097_011399, partial [Rhizophlyctis rosea]